MGSGRKEGEVGEWERAVRSPQVKTSHALPNELRYAWVFYVATGYYSEKGVTSHVIIGVGVAQSVTGSAHG